MYSRPERLREFNFICFSKKSVYNLNLPYMQVEAWVETITPGSGTPIHRHDCEEIFIIVKGGGTAYIAPESDKKFPGEPVATPFSANSTFTIPVNSVHRVGNAVLFGSLCLPRLFYSSQYCANSSGCLNVFKKNSPPHSPIVIKYHLISIIH